MVKENLLGLVGSMDLGHYHWHATPEIVIPSGFEFWFQDDKSVRLKSPADPRYPGRVDQEQSFDPPECVHWRKQDAPENERGLFFLSGDFTEKLFKGSAPTWWRMWTNVVGLRPGEHYVFTAPVFPDLVSGYDANSKKIFAPDPLSGEFMLEVRSSGRTIKTTEWMDGGKVIFGVYNFLQIEFEADADNADVVLEYRGRWGLSNNGVFTDDWRVEEADDSTPAPTPAPIGDDLRAQILASVNIVTAEADRIRAFLEGGQG